MRKAGGTSRRRLCCTVRVALNARLERKRSQSDAAEAIAHMPPLLSLPIALKGSSGAADGDD
jgi:hypothetical protein